MMKCEILTFEAEETWLIFFPFGNHSLKQVNETIFLGVYIDEHLTRKPHISFVAKQILSQPV